MSERHSTPAPAQSKPVKPDKPYPEFPLTAHPAGYWCKRIRGKLHYFGKWVDPDGALAKYLEQKDALHAGRVPRPDPEALTIRGACNAFLNAKRERLDSDELSPRTWTMYKTACDFLVKQLGKTRLAADLGPDDFAVLRNRLAKRYGPHGLGTSIQCIRCVFRHAYESGLMDHPMRYGPGFKRPSKKTLRLHRAKQGAKLFSAEEVRKLIGAASPQLRAMILLGINGGFGNADCGTLPITGLDLEAGVIDFPRPKTGIPRRCLLWPETVAALREALANRPEPKDPADAGLVFLTQRGLPWARASDPGIVTKEVAKLLRILDINGHRNFYTLRHTFRTIADNAKDQPAADFIMGHESTHMSTVYRETISDERLRAVVDHVHGWLFPPAKLENPADVR